MRNEIFDIMKGIGIIAVIIGHSAIHNEFRNLIFTWHMPMFFMISGYFYKNYSFGIFLKKNLKSLIIPYLFTSITLCILTIIYTYIGQQATSSNINIINSIWAIIYGAGSTELPNGGIYFIGAIWFLQALFWCRISFNIVYNNFHKKYIIILFFISTISTFVAQHIFIPTNILQGLSALIFFTVGYKVKELNLLKKNTNKLYLFIMSVIVLLSSSLGPIGMVTCYYPSYIINMIASIVGGYLIYYISYKFTNTKIGLILSHIGTLSLIILCIHIIDLQFFSRICYLITNKFTLNNELRNFIFIIWNLLIPIVGAMVLVKYKVFKNIFNIS